MSTSFADLKNRVSIVQVIDMLGLKLKPHGDKLRSVCPICKQGDDRTFVVTPAKGLFFCFKEGKGGDMLTLVSRFRGCTLPEAAAFIEGTVPDKRVASVPQPTAQGQRAGFDAEKYLKGLDPAHEALQPLGVSEATYREWKAGYSGSGVLRGKLALPIVQKDGTIIGYMGRALKDETPVLTFWSGTNPTDHIFGADRVSEGELTLVRDPLDVLRAWENGAENCICFLTVAIAPMQLEQLAALMDERKCQELLLF